MIFLSFVLFTKFQNTPTLFYKSFKNCVALDKNLLKEKLINHRKKSIKIKEKEITRMMKIYRRVFAIEEENKFRISSAEIQSKSFPQLTQYLLHLKS